MCGGKIDGSGSDGEMVDVMVVVVVVMMEVVTTVPLRCWDGAVAK